MANLNRADYHGDIRRAAQDVIEHPLDEREEALDGWAESFTIYAYDALTVLVNTTNDDAVYDADGPYGEHRPAINVKEYHSGQHLVTAVQALVGPQGVEAVLGEPLNARYPANRREVVYERIASDFWQAAEQIAEERGLGPIEQAGRSGGWLVFTDGRDPRNMDDASECETEAMGGKCHALHDGRIQWLADYAAMVAWCDAYIAAVPRKAAAMLHQMAMDDAGYPAARRMFSTYVGLRDTAEAERIAAITAATREAARRANDGTWMEGVGR